ncbi:putative F-box protein [Cardamine amara subsp. amara]|uniref:F-box protein n=1 Tax=Cardamine amara subsp. amara TaxID=228776 RepID=A0ABD1AEG5_CARAN
MKRGRDAEDRFCSSRSMLQPIPLDLKLIRLPAKFLMKPHQKKLLRICLGGGEERYHNEDNEKFSSASIPVDLEVEILTRLPVKSLMKFRCVSKMWSSIIRSQRFVDSYYAMSSTQSRFMIAFSCAYADNDARRLFIFSSLYEKEESSFLVANLDMTIPSVILDRYFSKAPSVHGFVGCPNGTSEFIVCNPSTRQVITLPVKGSHTYLGYDPVENQFKALTYVGNHISFLEYEDTTLGGKESP